jgi:hypothetical protein
VLIQPLQGSLLEAERFQPPARASRARPASAAAKSTTSAWSSRPFNGARPADLGQNRKRRDQLPLNNSASPAPRRVPEAAAAGSAP